MERQGRRDSLGRAWFEAENSKYHMRGYAMTDGFDAWIVYGGYKLTRPMNKGGNRVGRPLR